MRCCRNRLANPELRATALRRPVLASRATTASRARTLGGAPEAGRSQVRLRQLRPGGHGRDDPEEWDDAFDEDSWIIGDELLDRVAQELRYRVANRDVFARLERHQDPPRMLAYSDEGYAVVYPDGSVEGEGTVLRDVKPTVALCSMEDFEVNDAP